MSQDEIIYQARYYLSKSLNNYKLIELIIALLDDLSNELYQDGYTKESNTITTCLLSLKELQG